MTIGINMDRLQCLLKDIKDGFLDEQSLIDEYSYTYGRSPEDIIIEKEKLQNIVSFLDNVYENLELIDRKILELYILDKWTLGAIAIHLGYKDHSAISKRLKNLSKKIKNNFNKMFHKTSNSTVYIYEDFFSVIDSIPFRSGKLTAMKYPFELYKKCNDGGYWGKLNYKENKQYNSISVCKLPQYFQECFGDDKTVCSLYDAKECKNTKKHHTNKKCKPI